MEPLTELVKQLAENVAKAPGWLPLLLLCYLAAILVPEGTPILGHLLKSHKELTVSAVTLVLYILGDAFDKPVFKLLEPLWLDTYRLTAEKALSLKADVYRVSKSLAIAAEKYDRSCIRVKNESSKLFRSLVLPSVVAGIVLPFRNHVWLGVTAIAAGFVFLGLYVRLKASHMADLYGLTEYFTLKDEYEAYDLTEKKARLFFWKGELVSSARRGPAVVLLHGYPFDPSMWRDQIAFLRAHGYRAIAPDLRGLVEKRFSAKIFTMEDLARKVAALLDEAKVDRAVICGLSMGGYVAFEFAKLYPERLNGLVLAGTRAPADNEQEKQARFQQVEQMLAEGMSGIVKASLPKLLARQTLAQKPEIATRVREMILSANPHGAAAAQRGMAARRDYSDDLASINVPTLVIVGRDDPIRPLADAEFMHDRLQDSRLEIIEDAAHMTNMEQPESFNRALVGFLANAAGASPPS